MSAPDSNLPRLRRTDAGTQLIVDGRPFIMLGGEIHNSSASSLDYLEQHVWPVVTAAGCNTAIVPVYWELVEPEEGRFDFTLVDGAIEGARRRGLRLVLLWFGTWKNAMSTYAPAWVKVDLARFPRSHVAPGLPCGSVSAFSTEACRADARAFAALMRHLKETDGEQHTVLMIQVENEPGLLGAPRDVSPPAEEAYARNIPEELAAALQRHGGPRIPDLRASWQAAGSRTSGPWEAVFGDAAPEAFMAWYTARFINAVAAAGKAEYPLPMYANAWLVHQRGDRPGTYPSGGPVARMMDVWLAAAPDIDALAPDIYNPDFNARCAEYAQLGNPLIIPEAPVKGAEAKAFAAVAQCDALCFAPFGIDSAKEPERLAESYRLLNEMMPVLAAHQGTGRMIGINQESGAPQNAVLGDYQLQLTFHRADPAEHSAGRGLVIALSDTQYLVVGAGFTIRWLPKPGDHRQVEFLSVDEGAHRGGEWQHGRRLNGDEAQGAFLRLRDDLGAYLVEMHSYG
jgi:hypothetical protein